MTIARGLKVKVNDVGQANVVDQFFLVFAANGICKGPFIVFTLRADAHMSEPIRA